MPATNPSLNSSGPEPRLTLKGQLEDLARVWPWVQALAAHYSVPSDTQFSIQLCLEEALSNIVRHGYGGQPNQSIAIECAPAAGELVFTVEDNAPPFNPIGPFAAAPTCAPASIQELEPGGQGIRLMQRFASRLEYQRLPDGNRLTLAFAIPPLANP